MAPITNILIDASRKASRLLQRDYLELEMLQTSSKTTDLFCSKSIERTKEILHAELSRYCKYIYFSDDKIDISDDFFLWINPIEGLHNFSKALPFFAILISYAKKTADGFIITNSIINFPALGEIFYAEKGGGSWCEKISSENSSNAFRLRIPAYRSLDNAIQATDGDNDLITLPNHRSFGSYCYDTALLTRGKIDCVSYSKINDLSKFSLELIIKESGGFTKINNNMFTAGGEKIINLI